MHIATLRYLRRALGDNLSKPSQFPRCARRSYNSTASSSPRLRCHKTLPTSQKATLPSPPPPTRPYSTSSPQRPQPAQTHYTLSPLRREFLLLQSRFHPDKFPPAEKKKAEAHSARINEAYKTLQDPLRRAEYLLGLRGVEAGGEGEGMGGGSGGLESVGIGMGGAGGGDMELLAEVMEVNEMIEEAGSQGDIDELKILNEERIRQSEETLAEAFAADDLEMARKECIRLRYWVNLRGTLHEWVPGAGVPNLQH
ncbi:Co-chaperone Hsc20 [Aulographum hederae CBS 113979]|uniref:Co-chaperone Hsc20 n=1 Tax=Aulographum hederae CBS 113979 TaxID=1176131 RepID=A0A6G1GZ58_9PEZI|nr:Co-chaperone Hsc20 [Aulographum hederae CBS 113979]